MPAHSDNICLITSNIALMPFCPQLELEGRESVGKMKMGAWSINNETLASELVKRCAQKLLLLLRFSRPPTFPPPPM